MKRTPLFDVHAAAGAKMVNFAGWEMPVQYDGVIAEHNWVRSSVGIFDLTHMGEIRVLGSGALDFLQRCTTNDVSRLTPGDIQYTLICNEHGGIVDDILVYCHEWGYELVVNAANREKDLEWLLAHSQDNVQISDVSDETALVAVQGPKSEAIVSKALDAELSEVRYYHFKTVEYNGVQLVVSRTGYTGEDGFEIYLPSDMAVDMWQQLMQAGGESLRPIGLGARDTLRLEMCYSLYGNEIDDTTNPFEAGLGWVVKLDAKDFIGRSALAKMKEAGVTRRLVAVGFPGENHRAIPRTGYPVYSGETEVGVVTSGTFSPTLSRPICLAYVPVELSTVGTPVSVAIRKQQVPGSVVKKPFVEPKVKR